MRLIRKIGLSVVGLTILLSSASVLALGEGKFAVDAHAGSLGFGVGVSYDLNRHLNLRGGINTGELELIDVEDDEGLNYDNPTFEFDNVYALVDIYPARRGSFRITAGAVLNNNQITAGATVDGAGQFIGNVAAPIGTGVEGSIEFDSASPYVGIGWGNVFGRKKLVSFNFDLGVLLQGDPAVNLTITDPTGTVTEEDAELERRDLEEEVGSLDIWPVVNFNVNVRF